MKYTTMPCNSCGKSIRRSVQTKRSLAKCAECQKADKKERNKKYESMGKWQWTTRAEIRFINRLSKESARKYAVALEGRVFWGDIDQHEAKKACRERAGF